MIVDLLHIRCWRLYSLFRYGLDLIRGTLLKPNNFIATAQEWLAILFFWPPPVDFKAC